MKIIFVCHGNICRSPLAEYIFKYITNNKYDVISRATSTDEIGNDIYPPSKKTLDEHNIPYERHHATRITKEEYDEADYILVFDKRNMNILKSHIGDNSKARMLLDKEIDDPWYTREFDRAYNEIYEGCIRLKEELEGLR